MNKQVVFLTNNKVLHIYLSGFQKNHSTDSYLTILHDKILKGFKCLVTDTILIDFGFDTTDHEILFKKKMRVIGFSNYTVDWYKSYPSN